MVSNLEIDGLRARCMTTGIGPDVVLLHGWGCDLDIWTPVRKHLSEQGFRVTALDFPGFGASDEPAGPWSMDDYAEWFEKFLKARAIANPVLVGHSFGGRVAIIHAARHGANKVVLVDSAGIKPRRGAGYYIKVWSFKLLKLLALTFLPRQRAEKLIDSRRRRAGSADYNAASAVMRGTLTRVVGEDLRRYMPKIEAPTLLVWGTKDTATPISDGRKMERLIRGAGLVRFEGAGHYSFLERPGLFAAVLDSFLRS